MRREYLFLTLFAILGFTGGTTTQQWLAHDGTRAAPAYSFSAEPGLGMYRAGSGQICATGVDTADGRICFQDGQMQIGTGNVAGPKFIIDSATSTGTYFADTTTDTIGLYTDTSTHDVFIGTYGTRFVFSNGTATTYMHNYSAESGNLAMRSASGSAWTASMGFGYPSYPTPKLDIGGKWAVGVNDQTAVTGFQSGGADSLAWVVNSNTIAHSRNKDVLEITGADISLALQTNNGKPTGTDCDAAAEDGRLWTDYANNRLYVCNATSTNNWMYVDLVE